LAEGPKLKLAPDAEEDGPNWNAADDAITWLTEKFDPGPDAGAMAAKLKVVGFCAVA